MITKVFNATKFARLAQKEGGLPFDEIENVMGVFDGLSRGDLLDIFDKLDKKHYKDRDINLPGITKLFMQLDLLGKDIWDEKEPTATEEDFLKRVKEIGLKCKTEIDKDSSRIEITLDEQDGINLKDASVLVLYENGTRSKVYGEIGKKTDLVDFYGKELKVGDIVLMCLETKIPYTFMTAVVEIDGKTCFYGMGTKIEEKFNGKYDCNYIKIVDANQLPVDFRFDLTPASAKQIYLEYHNNKNGVKDFGIFKVDEDDEEDDEDKEE